MAKIAMIHPGRYMQCQSFAITGEGGTVIIDPGSGYFESDLIAGLRAEGVELSDVRAVLITHCHSDHAFGADRWQKRGARLLASLQTADAMRDCAPLIWCEHTELITPVIIDDILTDGQLLEIAGLRITCVATPGHTPGCMSFLLHDVDGTTAFTGDMLMSGGRPGWAGVDFSGMALIASLRKMQRYNIDKVYPGHGAINGDINEWLEAGIQAGCAGTWQLNHEPTSYEVPGI